MGKFFDDLYLNQNETTQELQQKQQQLVSILPEDYNWKTGKVIAETAWQSIDVSTDGVVYTPNKYLPARASIGESFSFRLDSKFIPFINVEILTKKKPNLELMGIFPHSYETYSGDYIELYGNGVNLIYKGLFNSFGFTNYFLQNELDNGNFDVDFTKKYYHILINYARGRIYSKDLFRLKIRKNLGLNHGSMEWDEWEAHMGKDGIINDGGIDADFKHTRFLSFTSTQVTMLCRKTEVRVIDDPEHPGSYIGQWTYFYNQTVTKSFSDMDLIVVNGTSGISFPPHTINTMAFTFLGYFLFWDSERSGRVGVRYKTPSEYEENSLKMELYGFPSGDDRVWNYMLFKRNDNAPTIIEHPIVPYFCGNTQSWVINNFQITDNVQEQYLIMVLSELVFKCLAEEQTLLKIVKYNDTYSQFEDTYKLTITNHTFHDMVQYSGEANTEYKIRLMLLNPYKFSDRNNYELSK
jgi:hypothetical protein